MSFSPEIKFKVLAIFNAFLGLSWLSWFLYESLLVKRKAKNLLAHHQDVLREYFFEPEYGFSHWDLYTPAERLEAAREVARELLRR